MQRRLRLKNRPQQLESKANLAKEEEAKKAKILFAIVILFSVCNIPRIVLNFEETYSYWTHKALQQQGSPECNAVPLWALMLNILSQLLLTINATSGEAIN